MSELPETTERTEVARPVPKSELNLEAICNAVMTGDITETKLAMLKEVVAIIAERKFAESFVSLQGETLKVQATRGVPGRDGTIRFKFAPFEDIMREIGPKLQSHGFTVTFSTEFADGRLVMACTLQHVGGHSKTNKFAVRVGSGPPNASECQADGAANTYAKRFALCNCLNIQIDHDTDAAAEGDPEAKVTADQAFELERRVNETNSNREAFLKLAGAKTYTEIRASKYAMLDSMLQRKERKP